MPPPVLIELDPQSESQPKAVQKNTSGLPLKVVSPLLGML
jgi:hypothetical protein